MATTTPDLDSSAALVTELDELRTRLETLASDGDWAEFAIVMQRRDALLPNVAVEDRAVVFAAALSTNERLLGLVRSERQDVSDQLVTLRRGKEMIGEYAANRHG